MTKSDGKTNREYKTETLFFVVKITLKCNENGIDILLS